MQCCAVVVYVKLAAQLQQAYNQTEGLETLNFNHWHYNNNNIIIYIMEFL